MTVRVATVAQRAAVGTYIDDLRVAAFAEEWAIVQFKAEELARFAGQLHHKAEHLARCQ